MKKLLLTLLIFCVTMVSFTVMAQTSDPVASSALVGLIGFKGFIGAALLVVETVGRFFLKGKLFSIFHLFTLLVKFINDLIPNKQ